MQYANKLELHYYFNDDTHSMDAQLRNKCEFELLAIINEVSHELGIKITIDVEASSEGGFKDKWKIFGENAPHISVVIAILALILSRIPLSNPELDKLKIEETKLSIQEKKLNIEKLKTELARDDVNGVTIASAVDAVDTNLKLVARRSNFYKSISHCHKIKSVGFSGLGDNNETIEAEKIVHRPDFQKFILHSNDMPALTFDDAKIEIISPVLKQGDFKWKGIYNGETINFTMSDSDFKQDVILKRISFQNGSTIECVLKIARKLNEVGEIVPAGFTVETVIKKIDGEARFETTQGKRHRFHKKEMASQGDLF